MEQSIINNDDRVRHNVKSNNNGSAGVKGKANIDGNTGINKLLASTALLLFALIAAPAQAIVVTYTHTDAQGSVVAISDQDRNVTRFEYEPYGLGSGPADGPGYTGHVHDGNSGLIYMQQRYYDPETGQFISTDPVGVSASTGANFNRYAYANNNPYKFIDPDGRRFCLTDGSNCGGKDRREGPEGLERPKTPKEETEERMRLDGDGDGDLEKPSGAVKATKATLDMIRTLGEATDLREWVYSLDVDQAKSLAVMLGDGYEGYVSGMDNPTVEKLFKFRVDADIISVNSLRRQIRNIGLIGEGVTEEVIYRGLKRYFGTELGSRLSKPLVAQPVQEFIMGNDYKVLRQQMGDGY